MLVLKIFVEYIYIRSEVIPNFGPIYYLVLKNWHDEDSTLIIFFSATNCDPWLANQCQLWRHIKPAKQQTLSRYMIGLYYDTNYVTRMKSILLIFIDLLYITNKKEAHT